MDYVQIALVVGLMALGGGLVFWPCSLQIAHLRERIAALAADLEAVQRDTKNIVSATQGVLDEEHLLGGAGAAGDRSFGVLLDNDVDPTAPPAGAA